MAFDGQRLVAVDIGILYGDSGAVLHHRRALKFLRERFKYQLVVCPSVIREIRFTAKTGSERIQVLTHIVRQDIEDSDYFVYSSLGDTYEKIIRELAQEFLDQGIIPNGTKNHARLVIEAAYFHCDEIITVTPALLEVDVRKINKILEAHEFDKLEKIYSPKVFGT